MKQGIFIAGIMLVCACNNNSADTYDLTDSLGRKTTDTTTLRNDTAYYERMNQKTGVPDTGSNIATPKRNDTAYYERLPNKTNPPDSGK